jgi:hypothetical protein
MNLALCNVYIAKKSNKGSPTSADIDAVIVAAIGADRVVVGPVVELTQVEHVAKHGILHLIKTAKSY